MGLLLIVALGRLFLLVFVSDLSKYSQVAVVADDGCWLRSARETLWEASRAGGGSCGLGEVQRVLEAHARHTPHAAVDVGSSNGSVTLRYSAPDDYATAQTRSRPPPPPSTRPARASS
jgi:hypothetical protein